MAHPMTVLYFHGMGGGGDSRIPSILRECLGPKGIDVVVRTYGFDPETALAQQERWLDELRPDLLVGESMGASYALAWGRRKGLPVLLVSPALNVGAAFSWLAGLTLVPGVPALLGRIYRPRPGDRQQLDFRYGALRQWRPVRTEALRGPAADGFSAFAFFGTRDHYRRSGIVSIKNWRRHFGDATYTLYQGSHFMEEEYVRTLLVDAILQES